MAHLISHIIKEELIRRDSEHRREKDNFFMDLEYFVFNLSNWPSVRLIFFQFRFEVSFLKIVVNSERIIISSTFMK